MNIRLRIACAILWLCCSSALSAQIGLSLPFVNDAAPGSNKSLSVRVTNFDSIVSMQYVVRWNPEVLKFLTIDNFGLPNLTLNNFNTQRALDSGFVRVVWEGPNFFPGTSVPDDNTIFRLRFNVIGPDTSSSQIKFTEITYSFPVTEFEFVKAVTPDSAIQINETQCALTHGFVAVGYVVAASEPEKDAFQLQISPNPFSEQSTVQFVLQQKAEVQLIIADVNGRVIHRKSLGDCQAGQHSTMIEQAVFPAKGAYYLTLQAGSQMSVRPISFL